MNNIKYEKHCLNINNQYSGYKICLVYPDKYSTGMSNLGFLFLYEKFIENNRIFIDRLFYDKNDNNIRSFEKNIILNSFDCICFSVPYEPLLLNAVEILRKSGIPVLKNKRMSGHPLIIFGGIAVTMNPLLMNNIADIQVLGETDEMIDHIISKMVSLKKNELIDWAARKKYMLTDSESEIYPKEALRVKDINNVKTISKIVSSRSAFPSAVLLEYNRGCSGHCSFCLTGSHEGGCRERDFNNLINLTESVINKLDAKVGLIGSDIGATENFKKYLKYLINSKINAQFSSLKYSIIKDDKILEDLKKVGTKTITIAPETASKKISKIIRKPFVIKNIKEMAHKLFNYGYKRLKLYFMVGFADENYDDVNEIVKFSQEMRGLKGIVQMSVSGFVPKPFTELAYCHVNPLETIKKLDFVYSNIKKKHNLQITGETGKEFYVQFLLSRGSSRTVLDIIDMTKKELMDYVKKNIDKVDNNLDTIYKIYDKTETRSPEPETRCNRLFIKT